MAGKRTLDRYAPSGARYYEDIVLVQTIAEPIGMALDALREVLSFLGNPVVNQKKHNNTLLFRSMSTYPPETPLKLKIVLDKGYTSISRRLFP